MFSNGITTGALAALLAGGQLAAAHMEISFPPPFRSKFNPHATNIDYTNTAPLSASGFPCKGYHSDLGTAAGASTATFAAGGAYNFTVVGGAPHGGGSCQVSLSYDKGKTFTVIQSIEGGCPLSSNYPFTIPADAPAGDAIWAWSWNNEIGNREFYMNCAPVTIGGGSKRDVEQRATTAFSSRPAIFVANLGNGCTAPEGIDVKYPNPGPDVVTNAGKLSPPTGDCGTPAAGGSGSGSDSGSGSGSASSSASAAPAPTAAPSSTGLPGGVFITASGQGSNTAAAVAPSPTTMVVSTVATSNAPAATGSPAGLQTAGTACTSEGLWNCIDGKTFQRCASGVWSVAQSVAAGTVCKVGQAATLAVEAAGTRKARRWRSAKLRIVA